MIKKTIEEVDKYEYFCDKCKRQVFYSGDIQEINGQDICSKCIEYPTKWVLETCANSFVKKDDKYYVTFKRKDSYGAYPTTKLVEIPNPNE